MTRSNTPTDADRIDAAINRVLEREREARAAIAECQERANALLGDARRKAQRIEARGEERVAAMHAICDRSVAQAIAALLGQRPPVTADLSPEQVRRLDVAIEVLADEVLKGRR